MVVSWTHGWRTDHLPLSSSPLGFLDKMIPIFQANQNWMRHFRWNPRCGYLTPVTSPPHVHVSRGLGTRPSWPSLTVTRSSVPPYFRTEPARFSSLDPSGILRLRSDQVAAQHLLVRPHGHGAVDEGQHCGGGGQGEGDDLVAGGETGGDGDKDRDDTSQSLVQERYPKHSLLFTLWHTS